MSLPPPGLPPEVFARSRAKAVAAELAQQPDRKLQAALLFELGALSELRLGERDRASDHYRDAIERDPSFRPALFALARLQRESRDDEALLVTLAKLAHNATSGKERASALVDMGCLLEDQLGDGPGAQAAFERALEADPSSLAASLMRERALLQQQHRPAASRLVARRASHTEDPKLRTALAVEAARDIAADGDIDTATEVLLTALAAPSRKLPLLLCLSELALRQGRTWVAARAYEDIGALLAGFAADQTGPEPLEIATRFPDRESASRAAAYYYHTAARLHTQAAEHSEDAMVAHERAAASVPSDVLIGLELASAYRAQGATSEAQALLSRLLKGADRYGAARLSFELAELAVRQGDNQGALHYLRSAYAATPDAPSIHAVLEDRLLDGGLLANLAEVLERRARDREGADQRSLLWRAALAAERAQDPERALGLWSSAVAASQDVERSAALREQYGLALRAQRPLQLTAAAEQLLLSDVAAAERGALWRARYEVALTQQDAVGARALLEGALHEPACDIWAPHTARLVASLRGDLPLLARAHDKLAQLAEQIGDPALAAAHRAAQGRALLRSGDSAAATEVLRRALVLSPASSYAVSLLERCLVTRGETFAAIDLLRDAARAFADSNSQQRALLHAGELAEAAGQRELATRSYDDAAARDPSAFSAQWARLRFAERSHDLPRRLSSLTALAERELSHKRPGQAHLELAELLAVRGEHAQAVAPLAAAVENDSVGLEAAATAALLPRTAAGETLRVRALSELAERTSQQTRRALEHERSAELLHESPEDARKLQPNVSEPRDAWLRFMLDPPGAHAESARVAVELSDLSDNVSLQAELALHALRCRTLARTRDDHDDDDTDALLHALGLSEDYPSTLGSALALCETLDAADDPDTRVLALEALIQQLPDEPSLELRAALARAQLDAGSAQSALQLHAELASSMGDDPSYWESLRVTARTAGDFEQVVRACDALARRLRGASRAAMLEEAAAVLHERLGQRDEAEQRLRAVLFESPQRQPAFERLHDVLIERADLDGLLALLAERIKVTEAASERVDLLYEQARILRARGDRPAALNVARELLAQDATHTGGLSLSAEILAGQEDWPGAVDALRKLADADLPLAQRRLAIEGCADFLEQKLSDHAAAHQELSKLVALDLADYSVHTRMAELAEAAGLQLPAAEALSRAAALSRGAQRAHLERRAATLFLSMGAKDLAKKALERALLAQPLDERAFSLLWSQLIEPKDRARLYREFTEAVRQALINGPVDAELLRALARAGQTHEDPELERQGLFALEAIGQASPLELVAAKALRTTRGKRHPARFGDARFTRLLPREINVGLLRLGQILSGLWMELAPDTPEKHGLRRRSRLGSQDTHPVREPLRELLELFGLRLSDMYISDAEPHALYPLRSSSNTQSWVVGRELTFTSESVTLLRTVPLVAAARAGLLGLFDSDAQTIQQRARLLLVAAGVLQDERLNKEASALAPKISQTRKKELTQAWTDIGAREDALQRLSRGCVLLGQRAAVVVAEDPVLAMSALGISAESASPANDVAMTLPKPLELLRFWLSNDCSDLLRDQRGAA
jgi:cellulose synthase operon protein C